MKVTEIQPNIITLEFRQEPTDSDYGSCLWARFYFNLDRYELTILSDCGNYGYKWYESQNESFLELMSRISEDYLIGKLYGNPDVFDYETSKQKVYDYCDEQEYKEKLDEAFEEIENFGYPESEDSFLRALDDHLGWLDDNYYFVEKEYPPDALKICSVFEKAIKPKIKEILGDFEQ